MKDISICTILLFLCIFTSNVYSQGTKIPKTYELNKLTFPSEMNLNNGITAVTVSKNDRSRDIIPAKESERFKIRIKIEHDSAFFTLKAEKFEFGKHLENLLSNEKINYCPFLEKGEIVFFEIVPDISKSNKLTLFTYFPRMTSFNYMNCPENKCIKYTSFEKPIDKTIDSAPLMLLYIDDKNTNEVEKLVNQFSKNGLITSVPQKYEKLFKNIEQYMLVHYKIEYKKKQKTKN